MMSVERKQHQQVALASDKQFVEKTLSDLREHPSERDARERAVDDRRLAAIFAPVPSPQKLLPPEFIMHPPSYGYKSAIKINSRISDLELPLLQNDEMEELVRVCGQFAQATPRAALGAGSAPLFLDRPSFCRLVFALAGLAAEPGGKTNFQNALRHFDLAAEAVPLQVGAVPGSTFAVGLPLCHSGPGLPALQALSVCRLFSLLLHNMALSLGPQGSHEEWLYRARSRLFGRLLPVAAQLVETQAQAVHRRVQETAPGGDAPSRTAAMHVEDGTNEEAGITRPLYAHTFAILKGEMLTSQTLEPEVLHFVHEQAPLFAKIFDVYCDVPTAQGLGHMTFSAFLRFCRDVELFPEIMDFQTLRSLYDAAESTLPTKRVQGDERSSVKGRQGLRVSAGSGAKRHRQGSSSSLSRGSSGSLPQHLEACAPRPLVLWEGRWLRGEVAWLVGDAADMSQTEASCFSLFSAIEEWIADRGTTIQELFAFFDHQGGLIAAEDFEVVVCSLDLEATPSRAELKCIADSLASGSGKTIDIPTLEQILTVIRRQKAKVASDANRFLLPPAEMTPIERTALAFLDSLLSAAELKGWEDEKLLAKLGAAKSTNCVSVAGLAAQAEAVLMVSMQGPALHLLDLGDGTIECEALCRALAQAREAREKAKRERAQWLLKRGDAAANASSQPRIFGCSAFLECLLKAAIGHLSYHGTPEQARQPSLVKALWLLLFLRWKLRSREAHASPDGADAPHALGGTCRYRTPAERLCSRHAVLFDEVVETRRTTQKSQTWHTRDLSLTGEVSSVPEDGYWGSKTDCLLRDALARHAAGDDDHQTFSRMLFVVASGELDP